MNERNRRAGQDEEGDEANQVNQNASTFDYQPITLLFHCSRPLLSYLFDLESTLLSLSLSVRLTRWPKKKRKIQEMSWSPTASFPAAYSSTFSAPPVPTCCSPVDSFFLEICSPIFFEYLATLGHVVRLTRLSLSRTDENRRRRSKTLAIHSRVAFVRFLLRFSISSVSTVVLKEFFDEYQGV